MKNKIIIFLSGSFHGPWCWEKFIPYFDQMNSVHIPEQTCHMHGENPPPRQRGLPGQKRGHIL